MKEDGDDDEDNDVDKHMQQEGLPRLTTYKEASYFKMCATFKYLRIKDMKPCLSVQRLLT